MPPPCCGTGPRDAVAGGLWTAAAVWTQTGRTSYPAAIRARPDDGIGGSGAVLEDAAVGEPGPDVLGEHREVGRVLRVAGERVGVGEVRDEHGVGIAVDQPRVLGDHERGHAADVLPQPAKRLDRGPPPALVGRLGPGEDNDVTDHERHPASPGGPGAPGARLPAGSRSRPGAG